MRRKGSYQPGDRVGSRQILLLEKDHKNERGEWYSWFECPFDGNKFLASHKHISDGTTYSCGCQKNRTNLVGQTFGKLKVIKDSGNRDSNRRIIWKCQCSCKAKSIVYVDTTSLLLRRTSSCGCIQSKGEEKIKKILQDLNIQYISQYKFDDCVNPKTNQELKFDFYLPDYNCCIEYDGVQHFQKTFYSHDNYKERANRDIIKEKYCETHNIPLIRIKYTDFDSIDKNYILERVNNV